MENSVKHFLLTRFNVASPGREQAIRLRPGWLDERFALFQELCLPSVAGQTRQDFEWVVFFDEETPAEYKRKIEALRADYPFTPQFTPMFEMDRIVPELLRSVSGARWLLTTRLDSDDILAADHIERLRGALAVPRQQVVNFRHGAILSIKGEHPGLYRTEDDSNPFASLMEPLGRKSCTIWAVKHVDIERIAPVLQLEGEAAWLQVVHGSNVSNRVKGRRVSLNSLEATFPYLATIAPASRETESEIVWENAVVAPLRQSKELMRKMAKPIYHWMTS